MNVKLMKTNAGKGYKIVVGDKWMYTSAMELQLMMTGNSRACNFRSIEDIQSANAEKIEEVAVQQPASQEQPSIKMSALDKMEAAIEELENITAGINPA